MDKYKFIDEQLSILEIPYELNEWTAKVSYPYSVGEFTEDAPNNEDGHEHTTLILIVFHRGKYIFLEEIKNRIKKHFCDLRASTDSGSIVVNYGGAFPIPSGEKDLKKIQINIDIDEWKGEL